ncbi:MAG TPA: hypothetical protein VLZ75_02595 [Chitinophagales bacterium]|nr:hypothetical protein [Chitinophagales bacterium]
MKNRDFTENTWENIHINTTKGIIHPIRFNGIGLNDIKVFGKNKTNESNNLRIEVIENHQEGDLYNIYYKISEDYYHLINKKTPLFVKSPNPPYLFDSEDGWFIESNSLTGHTIGDYWDLKIDSYGKECSYITDYKAQKGLLKKVNTIRVRLVDTVQHSIDREEVYIIGVGKKHHDHHLLFATIDSSEIINLISNPSENLKARCHLVILDKKGLSEFSDFIELDIASGGSSCISNKGMAFKAKSKFPINGSKDITTSLFNDTISKQKKIKFRVGGTGQLGSFGLNEIILQLLNKSSQKIGGVNSSYATLYLNGSYWSFGFPQEQPRKYYYSNLFHVKSKEINIANSFPFMFIDTIFEKEENLIKGNHIVFSEELSSSENYHFPKREMFIPETWLKSPITIFNKQKNSYQIIASIKDGNPKLFVNVLQEIMDLSTKSEDIHESYIKLNELINIKDWCKYYSIIHFIGKDIIDNNMYIALDLEDKLFPILIDFDDLIRKEYDAEKVWNIIFNEPKEYYEDITNKIAVIINKSDSGRKLLFNTYSEILQNEFTEDQINLIVNSTKHEVMKEYELHHKSWGGYPNGGATIQDQESLFDNYLDILLNRRIIVQNFLNDFKY